MDNLTHTLVGLAMGEAGLRQRSRFATATLVVGANLPDVDALIYLVGTGTDALAFRRGWTHGVLAMVVLPLLLTGVMLLLDRWKPGDRTRDGQWMRPGELLLIAALAVWSHPLLDWLNVYGVRLLMPFSDRWFYGDALFIIDPWVWLGLGLAIGWSRRRARRGRGAAARVPARVGLVALGGYLVVMVGSSRLGAGIVAAQGEGTASRTLVAPQPVTPVTRDVVRLLGEEYESGRLHFGWPTSYRTSGRVPRGDDLEGVAAAARTEAGRAFLSWARFPRFEAFPHGDSLRVRISDMRYGTGREASFAVVEVSVSRTDR